MDDSKRFDTVLKAALQFIGARYKHSIIRHSSRQRTADFYKTQKDLVEKKDLFLKMLTENSDLIADLTDYLEEINDINKNNRIESCIKFIVDEQQKNNVR